MEVSFKVFFTWGAKDVFEGMALSHALLSFQLSVTEEQS